MIREPSPRAHERADWRLVIPMHIFVVYFRVIKLGGTTTMYSFFEIGREFMNVN